MNSYILLRNNTESTSLNRDQLQQVGLKSSDLIWVECQSVCWQHPGEIAELKHLLNEKTTPDKNTAEVPPVVNDTQTTPIISKVQSTVITPVTPDTTITQPKKVEKKLVFVELPAKPGITKKQETVTALPTPGPAAINNEEDAAAKALAFEKKATELKTRYCRPLDEIKEMYVKNLEQKKEGNKIKKNFSQIPQQVKKVAVYSGLIITGALVMLFIKNTGSKKAIVPQQVENKSGIINASDVVSNPGMSEQDINTNINVAQDINATEEQLPAYIPEAQKNVVTPKRKIAVKSNADKTSEQDNDNVQSTPTQAANQEVKPLRAVPVENISSKLNLQANDYNVGSFGGIRNLEMTLQNDSRFLLEKVTVEIKYLNPEGNVLKSDNIFFESIRPGDAATIPVKKTKRGVKISYRVSKIEIKEGVAGSNKTPDSNNYSKN